MRVSAAGWLFTMIVLALLGPAHATAQDNRSLEELTDWMAAELPRMGTFEEPVVDSLSAGELPRTAYVTDRATLSDCSLVVQQGANRGNGWREWRYVVPLSLVGVRSIADEARRYQNGAVRHSAVILEARDSGLPFVMETGEGRRMAGRTAAIVVGSPADATRLALALQRAAVLCGSPATEF